MTALPESTPPAGPADPATVRPFRFGVMVHDQGTGPEWLAKARRIEALGYATFLLPDHLEGQFGAIPALAFAAAATPTLRFGTFVLANDFRHPVVLAKDVATLDLLTGGRFELGIGAGWRRSEYAQAGLPYDPGAVRVARLEEAIRVLKGLWADEPLAFGGAFYAIAGLDGAPKPAQRPHPPILVGGAGRQVLSIPPARRTSSA